MIQVDLSSIAFDINENNLSELNVLSEDAARAALASIWDEERDYLVNFLAVFYPKNGLKLTEQSYFITLAFVKHGYISEEGSSINEREVKQQILNDLDVLNREAGWGEQEKVFFEKFWPKPTYRTADKQMDFGLMLKDYTNATINKTLNRFVLTRYGHIELNFSILEDEVALNRPLSFYLNIMDSITGAMIINEPFRYIDIDYDNDTPSKSGLVHLALSAEKF